jgi:hypothetical protein
LGNNNIGIFQLMIGVVAVLALVLALTGFVRLKAITRRFAWITGGSDDTGSAESLPQLLRAVESNGRDIDKLEAAVERIVAENQSHLKRIGLVRFDAFEGIAGQQSYSLCVLDDKGNGVLLSNLVGRDFSRSYAIEISAGQAPRKLGEEESRALHLALDRVA